LLSAVNTGNVLGPEATLRRGYSITTTMRGENHPHNRSSPPKNENSHPFKRRRIRLGDPIAAAVSAATDNAAKFSEAICLSITVFDPASRTVFGLLGRDSSLKRCYEIIGRGHLNMKTQIPNINMFDRLGAESKGHKGRHNS